MPERRLSMAFGKLHGAVGVELVVAVAVFSENALIIIVKTYK